MGYAYSYKCSRCSYEEYFKQGYGFQVRPQSFDDYMGANRKLFHYKIHDKIISLSKVHPDLQIEAAFQVYKCPRCNRLHNKIQVSLVSGEGKNHDAEFRCTGCHTRLRLTNIHRLRRAACPACGGQTFHREALRDVLWG
ncbi:MAG TPA: hypothetical protein PK167_05980 [Prolixibacteraceae bacterium]|nr:hypothetical protein [Prolixibacteraceae bacterium]